MRQVRALASGNGARQEPVGDLAYYDNENNPSSYSLYNHRRREFRKKVGSYLDGKKGKCSVGKTGPLNHKGYSHKLKQADIHRYVASRCRSSGPSAIAIKMRPSVKLPREWHSSGSQWWT